MFSTASSFRNSKPTSLRTPTRLDESLPGRDWRRSYSPCMRALPIGATAWRPERRRCVCRFPGLVSRRPSKRHAFLAGFDEAVLRRSKPNTGAKLTLAFSYFTPSGYSSSSDTAE